MARSGANRHPDTQAGTTQIKFIIAIEAGTKKTAFGVLVPDLPGCFSAGDTVEEAFENARKAIKIHCEILAEEKKDLPRVKSMSEWQRTRNTKAGRGELSTSKLRSSLGRRRKSTLQCLRSGSASPTAVGFEIISARC
jgi:predicted RNase H-like HicB family nuclease